MVNVQHWKGYKAHYGSQCELGEAIGVAHAYQVQIEGRGVPVTASMLTAAASFNGTDENVQFPFSFHGTNNSDYRLHEHLVSSRIASNEFFVTESRMTDARKNIIAAVDFILNNRHATLTTINEIEQKILFLKEEYASQVFSTIGYKPVGDSIVWSNDSPQKGDRIKKKRKKGHWG